MIKKIKFCRALMKIGNCTKALVLLVLLWLVPILSYSQIAGSWLAVDSRQVTTGFISPLDGAIFDFGEQLSIGHVFTDTTMQVDYVIKNENIYIDDTVFANITHRSEDSLKLQFSDWMLTVFLPLKMASLPQTISDSDLIDNSWVLDWGKNQVAVNFNDEPWRMGPYDVSMGCITRSLSEWFDAQRERWHLSTHQGGQLLTITWTQFEQNVFNIKQIEGDTIILEYIGLQENMEVKLLRTPVRREEDLNEIKRWLTKKRWNTGEVIDYTYNGAHLDSLLGETHAANFLLDTTFLTKKDLLRNQLGWRFHHNGEYTIFVGPDMFFEGTWRLKPDGRTVVLNEGTRPEDYLNILKLDESVFEFSKSDYFSIGSDPRECIIYFYTVRME